MGKFEGFSRATTQFFKDLERNNNREYWLASKARFDVQVRRPFEALLLDIPERYQSLKFFRMNRDLRFSKDKTPYKLMLGARGLSEHGVSRYLHIDAQGLFLACGMHQLDSGQLARYREAVHRRKSGVELQETVSNLRRQDIEVTHGKARPLKSVPRGYAADHPRIELLRYKGLAALKRVTAIDSPKLVDDVVLFWDNCSPLSTWLDQQVGPPSEKVRPKPSR